MAAIIRKVTEIGLGDNADPTKNFKILVPDIADGTLKITRGDGTAVLSIDAAGKAVFPGNAQTWQDVRVSRAAGTLYTNNTLLPITVIVCFTSTMYPLSVYATVDGFINFGNTVASYYAAMTFVVPPGGTYKAEPSNGVATVSTWTELR